MPVPPGLHQAEGAPTPSACCHCIRCAFGLPLGDNEMSTSDLAALVRSGQIERARYLCAMADDRLDLEGADLSGADLSGVDFIGPERDTRTHLRGTALFAADLTGCRLTGARFLLSNLVNGPTLDGHTAERVATMAGLTVRPHGEGYMVTLPADIRPLLEERLVSVQRGHAGPSVVVSTMEVVL